MSIRHDPFSRPPWEPEDSKELLRFLSTRTGRRLIFRLQNDRPSLSGSKSLQSSLEANALWAKAIWGYEEAIRNIFSYPNTPVDEKAQANAYPSLDADSEWESALQVPAPLQPPPVEVQKVPNEAEQQPPELIPDDVPKPE